jgi:hypothetical protein
MEDLNEGIVEQYAEHLLKQASLAVASFTVAGVLCGAALGAAPGFLSHSLIPSGTKYFAVLLGLIAGGILGRSLGERRGLGLRLQSQLALRQLKLESRFVLASAAPAARPAAPAPVSPAVAAPAAPPVPAPAAPVAAQAIPPAVRALAPAPAAAPAAPQAAPSAPAIRTEAPAAATASAVPRLAEPSAAPALPPLSTGPS